MRTPHRSCASRGLLLLDVDGPLNPWAAKPSRRPKGYTTHRLRPRGWEYAKRPLRVWLNPEHGQLLLDLAADTGLELVWATTWEHQANTMIGPLIGLPELAVIEFSKHPGTLRGWKYPAVQEYAGTRPVAWLDDDFTDVNTNLSTAWSEFMWERRGLPTLLREVAPNVGLTERDFAVVRSWADTLPTMGKGPTEKEKT